MIHWTEDSDLTGVRDQQPLAKLPGAEQQSWRTFWKDVADLLKKARAE